MKNNARLMLVAVVVVFAGATWVVAADGNAAGGKRDRVREQVRDRAGKAGRPAGEAPGERVAAMIMARLELIKKAMEKLELTDDQKAKIKDIVEEYRKELEKFRDENKEAIREGIKARDREKVRGIVEKAPKVPIDKIKAVLTPEQLEKLHKMVAEWRENHGGGAATQPERGFGRGRPRRGPATDPADGANN